MRTDRPASWFRLYAEFATDPKVQMLSETDQRRFLMLLCLRCSNGDVTLHETEIAFQLRISDEDWQTTKNVLYKKGLINSDSKPIKWESRQFDSDTSNERVAKHRTLQKEKLQKNGNGDVTLQKRKSNRTETETETEKINTKTSDQPDGFDLFWQVYPKKVAKPAALKAFRSAKINGHLPEVLQDIAQKTESESWTKSNGAFIPNPSTYLTQRRWEDLTNQPTHSGVIPGAI